MIRTLPSTKLYKYGYNAFILLYFVLLFSPLIVIMVLAFNNSNFPSLPWNGFTLDWFFGEGPDKIGIFNDARNMKGLRVSLYVAIWVTSISTIIGTCAAFLFEQEEFRFKKFFYFLMIAPLVVPGVIIGIALLSFATSLGTFLELSLGLDVRALSPGLFLVVCGQCSFITTFVTLVIIARLKKFDRSLEEAAFNLGAKRYEVIWYITLPFLRPSIIGAAAVAFLLSFENFNTTMFLVGSNATLPITLFTQIKDGSTPVVNAISLLLITCVSLFAVLNFYIQRRNAAKASKS
ncbi:MAG: ABC transporter permease [Desulfobacula sp.]|jgi:spermidine/putrescine transport system permease protein|uniref:ABC transporter permease n=1 Tax=Desulfobacula sp. TaxID=2593537 RepID=UPI001DF76E1F|nr:ABC transporter permease [Desulfobacula sp.]MBT4026682.1 ABC transporter permease [Desulfobacula sp.]MBT4874773.1 ABC transporter permease [Desulfobacula sp.]MBT5547101.1 ABC transporter permease [Desulfobacula sp.]MBT6750870.1 ABC transporter permease [Desulfobacula sp.]